jgi:hypothetical protein
MVSKRGSGPCITLDSFTRKQLDNMPHVTVDLNSARVKVAENFNKIITSLNEHTESDGYIRIHAEEIQVEINALQASMATICHSYINGSALFDNISEDIPEFVDFNPNNY